jgi:hypothetical protein
MQSKVAFPPLYFFSTDEKSGKEGESDFSKGHLLVYTTNEVIAE